MKTSRLLLLLLLLASAAGLEAQTFQCPKNYELKVKEDYAKYEKDIIEAAKWLVKTPLDEDREKRAEVSAFVVKWVNGSPNVNVELNETILNFEKANPGMLVIYMACSARYVLENNDAKDMKAKHKFALHEMMTVYRSGVGIRKDKNMDKLIKADAQGKLDQWLEKNLKIAK